MSWGRSQNTLLDAQFPQIDDENIYLLNTYYCKRLFLKNESNTFTVNLLNCAPELLEMLPHIWELAQKKHIHSYSLRSIKDSGLEKTNK